MAQKQIAKEPSSIVLNQCHPGGINRGGKRQKTDCMECPIRFGGQDQSHAQVGSEHRRDHQNRRSERCFFKHINPPEMKRERSASHQYGKSQKDHAEIQRRSADPLRQATAEDQTTDEDRLMDFVDPRRTISSLEFEPHRNDAQGHEQNHPPCRIGR